MPTKGKYGARLRQCFLPGHVLQCTVVQYRATQHPTSGFLRKIRERDTRDPFTHAAAAHGRTSNILACKRGGFDLFCLLCLCLSKLLFAGVAYCLRTRLNISMTSSHPNMHTRVNKRFARSSEERGGKERKSFTFSAALLSASVSPPPPLPPPPPPRPPTSSVSDTMLLPNVADAEGVFSQRFVGDELLFAVSSVPL